MKKSHRFEIENTSNVGTPFYLAPELVENLCNDDSIDQSIPKNPYTPKSDMWALGVILYEMCALRKPFVAANEEELYKKIRETKPSNIPYLSR